jgi:hypothetical protein
MSNKTQYMQSAEGNVFSTEHPEYHKECKQLPKAEGERLYRAQIHKDLLKRIKPGSTVYTILRKVSSSGMSRRISVLIVDGGRIADITYSVSILTQYSLPSDGQGLRVNGCGMDMGFAVVYDLGRTLWPKGTKKPHGTRNGSPDTDGGYALKQNWL